MHASFRTSNTFFIRNFIKLPNQNDLGLVQLRCLESPTQRASSATFIHILPVIKMYIFICALMNKIQGSYQYLECYLLFWRQC